jgi:hypothetical protein
MSSSVCRFLSQAILRRGFSSSREWSSPCFEISRHRQPQSKQLAMLDTACNRSRALSAFHHGRDDRIAKSTLMNILDLRYALKKVSAIALQECEPSHMLVSHHRPRELVAPSYPFITYEISHFSGHPAHNQLTGSPGMVLPF